MSEAVVTVARHGDIAVIGIDNRPVNALSVDVRRGLLAALTEIGGDKHIAAAVIFGARGRFIAGADITELTNPPVPPHLPQVVDAIDALEKPVIAAIDGPALGGGLEIALACDMRIVSPRSILGLPETRLGLVPGAGGTQRLPRLVGILRAQALVATGEALPVNAALDIGLIDQLSDDPLASALQQARGAAKRRLSQTQVPSSAAERTGNRQPAISFARQSEPAVTAALSLVGSAAFLSFEEGLRRERQTFLALRESPESKGLIHLFLAGKAALKGAEPRGGTRRTASITIVGKSRRADRLAALFAQRGLTFRTGEQAIAGADLVIDMSSDRNAASSIARIASAAKAGAVIATTRARDIDGLAAVSDRSADIVGLGFRLSADSRALAEVIQGTATSPETLDLILSVLKRTKVQTVLTKASGLIGERIIAACRRSADELRCSGLHTEDEIAAALHHYRISKANRPSLTRHEKPDKGIERHLLAAMALEGFALVAEGVARSSADIDLVLVNGYGFPRLEGGPIWAHARWDDLSASDEARQLRESDDLPPYAVAHRSVRSARRL